MMILGLFGEEDGEGARGSIFDIFPRGGGGKNVVRLFLKRERESTWEAKASMPTPMTAALRTVGFSLSPPMVVRL